MIHHIVGIESTSRNGDPSRLCAPTSWTSAPPRAGSCITNASAAQMTPGIAANQKAGRQSPNALVTQPLTAKLNAIPIGSPIMKTDIAFARLVDGYKSPISELEAG